MEVSGVRSSWLTTEMNSCFIRSTARRALMSLKTTTAPVAAPASWWGAAVISTGNGVRSRRR